MRIGIDTRMYGKAQSGLGNYIEQLCKNLFLLDKENDYFLFLLEPIYSQYQVTQSNIHKIKVTSHWYGYSEQTKFLWEINKQNLDLMHFPHFNAPLFYNKKRVTTIHDLTPLNFPGHRQKSWWRKMAYQLTLKTSLEKSAKIIVDTQFISQQLQEQFIVSPDKIAVVNLGIEPDFKIIENYAKIKELKDKYSLTKPFIFFVSAWRNHKNFEGLIKAFNLLKKQSNSPYQLILGGQADPNYPDIQNEIKQSEFKNDIITPGFISAEDLPLFYNAAAIFVIPSFLEGFGLIGLEALACGVPVAASQTTSLPEILGDAALYFNPKSPEDIAAKINDILTKPELKNQLRQKGLTQIKKFSWTTTAQETLKIYQQILNQ